MPVGCMSMVMNRYPQVRTRKESMLILYIYTLYMYVQVCSVHKGFERRGGGAQGAQWPYFEMEMGGIVFVLSVVL